jgi:molecular chaperone GrpE
MQSSPANRTGTRPAEEQQAANDEGRDLEAELAQMENRYKRALADLDNYRKRSAREADRRIAEASDAQLREWLEVVDSIERALIMGADSPVVEGLRAVLEQMESILTRHGVQRIGAAGERFDPARHEAIGVQSADGDTPDQTVVSVPRAGYLRDGRVLRPAQVIVARASPE